jgi:hypothetical protein
LISYDNQIQKGCFVALIILAYGLLVQRFTPNDNISSQKAE